MPGISNVGLVPGSAEMLDARLNHMSAKSCKSDAYSMKLGEYFFHPNLFSTQQ